MSHNRVRVLLTCLILANASPVGKAVEFAGGTGTADDPYLIATAKQMIAVGQDEALWSKHFALVADISMDPNSSGELVVRGLTLTTGSLDGRGHGVRNLGGRIVVTTPGGRPETVYGSALFEHIGPGAIVSNLRLAGTFVDMDRSDGLATLAYQNAGRVVNCSAEGTVSSPNNKSPSAGILVGKNTGAIVACSAAGNVAGPGAGALVGENTGAIINCDAAGSVVGEGSGGLVGINSGIIMHSHSTCSVTGGSGLVEENSGTIVGCYANGDVTAGSAGLVGTNRGTVRWCCATGDVQASEGWAGGLVAVNSGTISQCYATGRLSAADDAGGLVGSNGGVVRQCYALGGGGAALVADYHAGIVMNCYALSPFDGGGVDNGVGLLLTDAQMRRQDSFVGWDFSATQSDGSLDHWTIPTDGDYPALTLIEASGSAGTGTVDDPYLIETFPQLVAVSREPGACYRVAADIDLQGESFGSSIIPVFWGHFDGAGHSVSNFTLGGEKDLGLFGALYAQATVFDLCVKRVQIVLSAAGSHPEGTAVGALAVRNLGTVTDCSTSVDISIQSESYFDKIGGLIGINEAGEIRRCTARFAMTHAVAWSRYSEHIGGLVGHNAGTIIQCRASSYMDGRLFASGGLVGRNDGHVADCYADGYLSGYVEGRMPPQPFLGGLVGSNTGCITRCYATTRVAAPDSGALVGDNAEGAVTDSYFLFDPGDGSPDNGWGLPLSDRQMRRQASFVGWDFETTWMVCEGEDYPRLQWENVVCVP